MSDVPAPTTPLSFAAASQMVVDHLKRVVPLGFWAVTRRVEDRQVYLTVTDDAYGRVAGDSHAWSQSLCRLAVTGGAPQIAPDAMAVPAYAAAGVARQVAIGTYVGIPIRDGTGELFGTICGLDPAVADPALLDAAPLLDLLAALLGQVLQTELLRTQAVDREAELDRRAVSDQLTALPNRSRFLDRVAHAVDLHRRDLRPLAVLVFDLDDFKAVNDALGARAGDALLSRVAERLRGAIRPGDTLARLSGDEFAVLVEDGGNATALAGRVVDCFTEPFVLAGTAVRVSASVGIADLPADAGPLGVESLLARADVAMQSAKRAGRGRLALYDPAMTLPESRDVELREPLRAAIADGGLRVHFQPLVDLVTGEVTSFEALARWRHGGWDVPPDVFVPVAARGGLLTALTDRVVELVAAQLERWSRHPGWAGLRVGVNVPPDVLGDPGLPGRLAACAARHGVDPRLFVLEVTEDALVPDPVAVRSVASELGRLGVALALDDFGTGYSSLLQLLEIPLTAVKIDRGFTADVDTDPRTERFMRAVLALGRDLGLEVIVEGVERQEQADVLARLGARWAQGWLFGRPEPAAEPPGTARPVPRLPARTT